MAADDSAKLRSLYSSPAQDTTEAVTASLNRTSLTSSDSYPNSPETTELTGQLSRQPSNAGHYRLKEVPTFPHANEVIDQSQSHNSEKVVEISPSTGRYLRLNTLLGKGAYKIVYKAIDREEVSEFHDRGYRVVSKLSKLRRVTKLHGTLFRCVVYHSDIYMINWTSKRDWYMLPVQISQSPNNKDLEHEIQILKSVRHPNIIAFHEAWYGENEIVFITELMTSGTLRWALSSCLEKDKPELQIHL